MEKAMIRKNHTLPIRAILFDKDDTLIDLQAFWRKPVEKMALQIVHEVGVRDKEAVIRAIIYAAGFQGDLLMEQSPIVSGTNADVVDAWIDALSGGHIYIRHDVRGRWIRDLEAFCLREGEVVATGNFEILFPILKEKGIHLGIATSDSYEPTFYCLKKLGIEKYFDCILTADTVMRSKPCPDMAEQFSVQIGIPCDAIAMVGDSLNDMRFAKNSHMIGIYYQRQITSPIPKEADSTIHHLEELIELVM